MKTCKRCIFELNVEKTISYKKNDFLFFEGDKVETIYLIREGLIKLEKLHENGEVRIIDIVKAGDYIALLTILQGGLNYIVTAIALTDCTVTPISCEDANEAYLNNQHFKETCLECAANRLGLFQGHTFNNSNTEVEMRILNILKHLSIKFGIYENGNTYIVLPINKTDLANMVGLRRETLSRKLTKMQKAGQIEINKNRYKLFGM